MQVFGTEQLLRELAERVIVSKASACMVVVDELAGQKARSEGPVQPSQLSAHSLPWCLRTWLVS